MFRIGKSMVTESKLVVAKGWEGENGSDCLLGPGHPFRSNGIILEVDSVKHTTVYFRMVKTMNFAYANFISTKLKATSPPTKILSSPCQWRQGIERTDGGGGQTGGSGFSGWDSVLSLQGAWVWSLVGEVRSCMLCNLSPPQPPPLKIKGGANG